MVHASINAFPWDVEPDPEYNHETRGIHVCSFAGREKALKVLLGYKPDLEVVTFDENKGITTPLVIVAWEGSVASCRLLLEHGANPNTWASAESPQYAAAEHQAWEKVALLLAFGARHDIFTASICGECDVVELEIRAYKPLLERRSIKRNRTPLEEAVEHGQDKVVDLIKNYNDSRLLLFGLILKTLSYWFVFAGIWCLASRASFTRGPIEAAGRYLQNGRFVVRNPEVFGLLKNVLTYPPPLQVASL